jgi:hypothetical protein
MNQFSRTGGMLVFAGLLLASVIGTAALVVLAFKALLWTLAL